MIASRHFQNKRAKLSSELRSNVSELISDIEVPVASCRARAGASHDNSDDSAHICGDVSLSTQHLVDKIDVHTDAVQSNVVNHFDDSDYDYQFSEDADQPTDHSISDQLDQDVGTSVGSNDPGVVPSSAGAGAPCVDTHPGFVVSSL